MMKLTGKMHVDLRGKWRVINVPEAKAADFEAACKSAMALDRMAYCQRLGTSGGYVGYNYAGCPEIPGRFAGDRA